jgi:Protein of unknown function (DUF3108)
LLEIAPHELHQQSPFFDQITQKVLSWNSRHDTSLLYTRKVMRFFAGVAVFAIAFAQTPPAAKNLAAADLKTELGKNANRLTFDVEWRLIRAGTVVVETEARRARMKLESAGMVSALIKIQDTYSADFEDSFCATSTAMDSLEGKRHHDTRVTYDRTTNRAAFLERDVVKDSVLHSTEIGVPHCVHEIVGAILSLREMTVPVGQSVEIPLSDGRRAAPVKVAAQAREEVRTPMGTFQTVRYEPDMLNGIVYSRKGHALIWLTDDERRLPVQIRLRMQFPIGTVTLQLAKEEKP